MSEEELKEQEEKAVSTAEIVNTYVPPGVMSFADLDAAKESEAISQMTMTAAEQFMGLARNILYSDEIENKAAAISALASEFKARVNEATEAKEAGEEKAKWSTKYVNDLPDSAFLHIKSGGEKDNEGKTKPRSLRMFPYKNKAGNVDLPHLRNAIARAPQADLPSDVIERVQSKARRILKEQQKEIDDASLKERVTAVVKSLFGLDKPSEPEPFTVWKERDGVMRWMAVYSNNYRDDDGTPEIISKEAHLDFVRAVDGGEWPMPELWHWHVPGSRYGVTDLVAYDVDTGMALAAGTVDKGKEEIAQRIFERNPKVSHGMPTPEIRREEGDPTVLVRYRSKEISTLPPEAAANKITFYDLKEQDDMEIPEKKLEALRELGFDMDELEAKLGAGRERAESEERESKEAETKAEETEAVAETEQAQPDAAPESAPEQEPLTAEAVAAAFTSAIAPITERLDALEGQIKELSEPTETKEEEPDKTPQASLASLMKSAVIGKEATRVDGRTTRHDAPAETVATKEEKGALNTGKLLPDTIINDIVSGRLHRELREKFGAQEQ